MKALLRFVVVLVVLVAGDALWLSHFAHAMFRPTLGAILLDDPRWGAVLLFYPLYAMVTIYLAIAPSRSFREALARAAVFGFMAYATYDLTNFATIKAWTMSLGTLDTAWGTILTTVAAACGWLVARPEISRRA